MLPATPAADMHSTRPPDTDRAATSTDPPSTHVADAPSSAPAATSDTMLPPSTAATDGDTRCTDTAPTCLYCSPLSCHTPAIVLVLTYTFTSPATPTGATHFASLDDSTSASVLSADPNRHAVRPATKPSPLSVTMVPPLTTPKEGSTDITRPAGTYSTCTPLWLIALPSPRDTSTTCIPAPRVGTMHPATEDDTTDAIEYDQDVCSNTDPPTAHRMPDACIPEPLTITSLPPATTLGLTIDTFTSPMY